MADDWKAERVAPSAILPPAKSSIMAMDSVNDLNAAESSAPGFHRRVLDALKASGKVKSPHAEDFEEREPVSIHRDPIRTARIERGSDVRDIKTKRRGIVIKACAGYTKRSHTPVHRIADRHGDTWLAKSTDLRVLG